MKANDKKIAHNNEAETKKMKMPTNNVVIQI